MADLSCDILIVGGGVAGLSAAAAIAPHASVVLIEAEDQLAHHASSRSAALYEPYYGPPAIRALSLDSRAAFDALEVLSERGVMVVAGPEDAAGFDAELAAMNLSEVTPDEAADRFPLLDPRRVARAGVGAHAWDIDTDRLVQGYARDARSAGAQLLMRAPLKALRRSSGGWQAQLPQGTVTARRVIDAAGAWADVVARMAGVQPIGLEPRRRSMARIPVPAGMDPARWPMIFGAGETWYAKPDAGALIVSPADAEPMEPHDAWADDMTLAEGLARYEAMMRAPVDRLLASWAGLRSFSPDGVPVFGADPQVPDFIWLAGQGGYGFQSAPAAARFIADVTLGRSVDPQLAALLSPGRLRR